MSVIAGVVYGDRGPLSAEEQAELRRSAEEANRKAWEAQEAEIKRMVREHKERMARVVAVLRSAGITMSVDGCGCCDSPRVTFEFGGEVVLDDEGHACFSTDPDSDIGRDD